MNVLIQNRENSIPVNLISILESIIVYKCFAESCLLVVLRKFRMYHYFTQNELLARQKKGLIDQCTLVLAIEDRAQGVGSGGATLNALYVTAEHLGIRQVRLKTIDLYFRNKYQFHQ